MNSPDFDMSRKIMEAVDAAHPAGMIGDEAHKAELNSRLDQLAREFMATRPDLEAESLDDWMVANGGKITGSEYLDTLMLLEAYK